MANTETLTALRQVREARKAVADVQLKLAGQLTVSESNTLTYAYSDLEDLEDMLVLEDIKNAIGEIKSDADDLQTIADNMKQVSQRLGAISDTIAKAAKLVGALADILAKATSSGLL